MIPPLLGVAGSVGGIGFVGAVVPGGTSDTATINWPTGTGSGQLGIICTTNPTTAAATLSGGAGGWSSHTDIWTGGSAASSTVFWKVLAVGDLGGTVSISGAVNDSNISWSVYRGCSALTYKSNTVSATNSISMAGFTKSPACKGLFTRLTSRNFAATATVPTGFAQRYNTTSAGDFIMATADLLIPANYVNNTAVVWSVVTSTQNANAALFEIT